MNTIDKHAYTKPQVERIDIDNEISLQLESEPPIGPEEFISKGSYVNINIDPFKSNIC